MTRPSTPPRATALPSPIRRTAVFLVGGVGHDAGGEYAILTFPNKDNLLIHRGEEVELAYDEFTDTMGDNCHNVYEGTVALE